MAVQQGSANKKAHEGLACYGWFMLLGGPYLGMHIVEVINGIKMGENYEVFQTFQNERAMEGGDAGARTAASPGTQVVNVQPAVAQPAVVQPAVVQPAVAQPVAQPPPVVAGLPTQSTGKTIYFESSQPLGIGLKQEGGAVVVSNVEKASAACDVPLGTQILAVSGESCAGKTKAAVVEMVKVAKANGTAFSVTFNLAATVNNGAEESI